MWYSLKLQTLELKNCEGLPLRKAVRDGDARDAERLLSEGASPNAKRYGTPVLVLAAIGGHLGALKLLRRHGAKLVANPAKYAHCAGDGNDCRQLCKMIADNAVVDAKGQWLFVVEHADWNDGALLYADQMP